MSTTSTVIKVQNKYSILLCTFVFMNDILIG